MGIINTENIFGKDGFVWWIGVIEERKSDPDKLGRVKVRIMGYHSDDLEELPIEDLPWAIVMQPTTSAAISGLGSSPTNLLEGTWVIGFFLDSKEKQQPIVIGSFGGFTQKVPFCGQESTYEKTVVEGLAEVAEGIVGEEIVTDENGDPVYEGETGGFKGIDLRDFETVDYDTQEVPLEITLETTDAFQDPNQEYPKCSYIDKPDTNKLATGDLEDDDTYVFLRLEDLSPPIETALDGGEWDEPEPAFCAEYPYNQVFETTAGHVVEFDNTPGKERIHVYHKAGTYIEIDVNGTMVRKVQGDNFELIEENNFVSIKGAQTVTIAGASKILVMGDAELDVRGDMKTKVTGDYNLEVGGEIKITSESYSLDTGVCATGATTWGVTATGAHIAGGSIVALDAGTVDLNCGSASPPAVTAPDVVGLELPEPIPRPDCNIEPPEYIEPEVEDFFTEEGIDGIPPIEYEEVDREYLEEAYVPPDPV